MEQEKRQEALRQLLDLAAAKGYVTFDDTFDCSEKFSLSIGDLDWLSESVATHGVIVYETEPSAASAVEEDDFEDYAQSDYDQLFRDVVAKDPSLAPLIEDIRNIIPPQRGEVERIKHQVEEGNLHARQRLIEMHMRHAVRIAWARSRDYDADLSITLGDALVGLTIAADKYDPDSAGKFASYASMWMLQNINREQSVRNNLFYYAVHRKEVYYSVYPVLKRQGCTECSELWTCQEAARIVAEKAGETEEDIRDIIKAVDLAPSMEALAKRLRTADYIYEETGDVIYIPEESYLWETDDELTDGQFTDYRVVRLEQALDNMPERMRMIVRARLGLDGEERTLEELGQELGLTRERVRQIEKKGMLKLENVMYAYKREEKRTEIKRVSKEIPKTRKKKAMANLDDLLEEPELPEYLLEMMKPKKRGRPTKRKR